MKISIICVGKIKKQYMKEFIDDYKKRISKYSKVDIIELKDVELKDESDLGVLKVLEEEGRNIEKHLLASSYKICLAIEGKEVSSNQLAKVLEDGFNKNANISFIIGGSYGISDEIKKKCDLRISFSKMTFPHQLMRGILLEQVYRGFKINNNESYHK